MYNVFPLLARGKTTSTQRFLREELATLYLGKLRVNLPDRVLMTLKKVSLVCAGPEDILSEES